MAKRVGESNVVVSTLLFAMIALTALLILLTAFIVWFASLIGSLSLSLLITGGALAIIAYAIYKIELHPTLVTLRAEWESLIAVVQMIRRSYNLAIDGLLRLFTHSD